MPATTHHGPDASIEQEIGLDQAFAAANGLPNYTPAAVVTGEHSGIENPNMPAALAGGGRHHLRPDASRQPQQYSPRAHGTRRAPRYPSNIYYNASNWPDELNEYNTLYVAPGDSPRRHHVPERDRALRGHLGHHLHHHAGDRGRRSWPRSRTSC